MFQILITFFLTVITRIMHVSKYIASIAIIVVATSHFGYHVRTSAHFNVMEGGKIGL